MKPKFNIPLQVSEQELNTLIRMYAERLHRSWPEDEVSFKDWIRWNTRRLSELVAMLDHAG
jgi:hypothetical protein